MHNLIPHFIYEQYEAGRVNGRLQAVTLFLDISGFTAMTQSLMAHGKEGAEIVAILINQVFDPIINTVYEHGGFVTGFAGDALTIVFPQKDERTALTTCHTALTIARIFTDQSIRSTKFGNFTLAVKQGLSAGEIEWGIVGLDDHKTYFFRGQAIDGCAVAEQQAEAGDIIIDEQLQLLLPSQTATLTLLSNQFSRLSALSEIDIDTSPIQLPAIDRETMTQFFPLDQWQATQQGEFRDVATLFVSFQGAPNLSTMNHFISQVMTLVDQFDGFFVEIDFGDKGGLFLVYFGAPTTHENDVDRALSFILTLQSELADIPLVWRAGITFGTVYAGYVGIPLRDKYTCLGSAVNLAAHLMVQAKWGQVLVSKSVALHPGFDFISLGQLPYKGFAHLVPTYLLEGKVLAERIFAQKMVGRETELEQLVEFVEQTLFDDQKIGVALIYGEAGIGKSHLTYALGQALGGKVRWMTGQSASILRQAFNPFGYFLKGYFGQAANVTEAENKRNFDHRLQDLLLALSQMTDARYQHDELIRTQSFLGALLDLYWPDSLYERLDAEGRYENTMIAIRMLLQAECRRQPVVLELEDGHWFDEASRELLTALTRQIKDVPLFILVTSRYADDGSAPEYHLAPNTPSLTLELTALTAVSLQQLAQQILNTNISNALQTVLLEKSQANPFFAQQILYYLQENGLLQVERIADKIVTTLTGADFELPTTLNTLLVARLDRLTQEVKEVVQTAAVLGHEFESRLLTQILERDLIRELNAAEREQIWTQLNALQYIFKHILLRDAAYGMQLRSQLKTLHYLAAQIGEKLYAKQLSAYYPTLAYHYETAHSLGHSAATEKARTYLQQAGEQAVANFENKQAIDYFSRAIALTPEDDVATLFTLYLAREKIYDRQGESVAQETSLDKLAVIAQQLGSVEQAQVALRQASHADRMGQHKLVEQFVRQAITWAQQATANDLVAEGYAKWGKAMVGQGEYLLAERQYRQGLAYARLADAVRQEALCHNGLGGVAYFLGHYNDTQHHIEQALMIGQKIDDLGIQEKCLTWFGATAYAQGWSDLAQSNFEQALIINQKMGSRRQEGNNLANLGSIFLEQGVYKVAHRYYQRALIISQETNARTSEGVSLNNLGCVAFEQQQYLEAQSYFEQAYQISQKIGKWVKGGILNNLGAVTLVQTDLEQADIYYQQAMSIHQTANQPHHLVENWAGLAKVKLAQGDLDSAGQYGQQIVAYLSDNPHLDGANEPMRTFRFAWEVLMGLGKTADADHILTLAIQVIQRYLDNNSDPDQQELYLKRPDHKVVWEAWQEISKG